MEKKLTIISESLWVSLSISCTYSVSLSSSKSWSWLEYWSSPLSNTIRSSSKSPLSESSSSISSIIQAACESNHKQPKIRTPETGIAKRWSRNLIFWSPSWQTPLLWLSLFLIYVSLSHLCLSWPCLHNNKWISRTDNKTSKWPLHLLKN